MAYQHQLTVFNNLSSSKELFRPIDPKSVRMYVCGMTVYDYCHIGHARVLVVFDVINRYLRRIYGERAVHYVRNITDIDDKIIARANENGEPFSDLTGRFIESMHQDADRLGVQRPDDEPCATAHISEILTMIESLLEKGYAYHGNNGDIYYDVSRFDGYGQLSGKNTEDLRAGARVDIAEAKDDPLDFVLWKAAKPEEPSWESPWGTGRPGWHIECSAMSTHCLGDHFDIHGGGRDLQFPHHENEIAQSEGATGCKFVNYWLHNGFVSVDNEKMSKSLGNFFTIREVLERYDAEVIRYFILTSHYRSPLNYSDQHLDNAQGALTTLYRSLQGLEDGAAVEVEDDEYCERFYRAMDDDFNTPEALAVLFELARDCNRLRSTDPQAALESATRLRRLAAMLGLLEHTTEVFFRGDEVGDGPDSETIEALIAQRLEARAQRDWESSDRIRDQLASQGIVLEDGPEGTTWRRG